jgi:hypothetical protein
VTLDTRWKKTLRDVTGYRGRAVALFIALSIGIFTISTMLGAYGIVRREIIVITLGPLLRPRPSRSTRSRPTSSPRPDVSPVSPSSRRGRLLRRILKAIGARSAQIGVMYGAQLVALGCASERPFPGGDRL